MNIVIPKVKKKTEDEKTIESYLTREIAKLGGTAYKFNSEQRRAVPDRLCVLPGRVVIFVECKRPGKEPTPAQQREIDRLREKDQFATWVSTKEEVDFLIHRVSIKNGKKPFLSSETLRKDEK